LEWLSAQLDVIGPFFFAPHPVSVAVVIAYGLFWSRLGPSVALGRPGAFFGLVAGAGMYAITQVWVRGEPTTAILDLIASNTDLERMDDARPLIGVVEALIAGYAEEIVKMFLALLVLFAMGYPRDPRAVTTAAVAPALGLALFGANVSITLTLQELPIDQGLAFPVIEHGLWVGLNLGTAYLLAKGWLSDRLWLYLAYAGLLHAIAVYTHTLANLGWHPVVVTAALAVVTLSTFTGGAGAIPSRR